MTGGDMADRDMGGTEQVKTDGISGDLTTVFNASEANDKAAGSTSSREDVDGTDSMAECSNNMTNGISGGNIISKDPVGRSAGGTTESPASDEDNITVNSVPESNESDGDNGNNGNKTVDNTTDICVNESFIDSHWIHYSPHFCHNNLVRPHLKAFYPYIEHVRHPSKLDVPPPSFRQEGRGVRPIALSVIRGWLAVCRTRHGEHCEGSTETNSSLEIKRGRPGRLIDVERWCVVSAGSHAYVTLSYVWGTQTAAESVELTDDRAGELATPNGLRRLPLPKTIVQAMELVRRLGERYLWVDRLCINQSGGLRGCQDEMAEMAEIYAGAVLTIVAAQGKDAMDPLWVGDLVDTPDVEDEGPGGEREPREDIMHSLARSLVKSTWFSRGWTFQEYHFSRRKLIFCGDTVAWECHCASWHEAQRTDEEDEKPCGKHPPGQTGFDLDPWPNFHRFARMLCLFNARHLTYSEDALHALNGALSALSSVFEGGFVSGLPQTMFDAALLWQPYYPLQRRKQKQTQTRMEALKAILPSWSPLGWWGSIYSENWVAGCSPVKDRDPHLLLQCAYTVSTVAWEYEFRDEHVSDWLPINVSTDNWRRRFLTGRPPKDLKDGWSFDTVSGTFRHVDDPAQEFWHPVPICNPGSPRRRPVLTPHIRGKTRSANLVAVPRGMTQKGNCAQALIKTVDGAFIGYIRMNESGSNTEERRCLLIELSRGETRQGHDGFVDRYVEFESGIAEELGLKEDEPYSFVNVMWVTTDKEIAERVAVGRVKEEAWEAVAGKMKKFTLG